jgi:low affinity Fe/Cu permease
MRTAFDRIATLLTEWFGTTYATLGAIAVVAIWILGGVLSFGFGTDYQIWVNTGTTIVTFLMVFIIQNTQNRDNEAMHVKLDELIRAVEQARNEAIGIEHLSKEELDRERESMERHKTDPDESDVAEPVRAEPTVRAGR